MTRHKMYRKRFIGKRNTYHEQIEIAIDDIETKSIINISVFLIEEDMVFCRKYVTHVVVLRVTLAAKMNVAVMLRVSFVVNPGLL